MPIPAVEAPQNRRRLAWLAIAAGVGLLVTGLRWALLAAFGSDVPYWDEWGADGAALFKPWLNGHLTPASLFSLHNEHRIALTRLWELGFFIANQHRWDPLLVQTANALCAGLTAALVLLQSARSLPGFPSWVLAGVLATLVVPFGYSNLLIAFQSQFLFFALFTVVAIGLWSRPQVGRGALMGGVCCAALALLTVGSGLLVPVTLAAIALYRLREEPVRRGFWLSALGLVSLVAVIGVALSPAASATLAPVNSVFAAAGRYLSWPAGNFLALATDWPDSARYFPAAIGHWPSSESPWILAFATFTRSHPVWEATLYWLLVGTLHAPGICLLVRRLRGAAAPASLFIPAMLLWVWLNVALMALARPDEPFAPPRYQDILVLGVLANALACGALLTTDRHTGSPPPEIRGVARRWPRGLAGAWFVGLVVFLGATAYGIFAVQLPRKRSENRAAARLVQQFLTSGDERIFLRQPPNHVPWPNAERELARVLRDPAVRTFLPRGILPERERPPAPPASRIAAALRASGRWCALAGILLIAVGWIFTRPIASLTSVSRPPEPSL